MESRDNKESGRSSGSIITQTRETDLELSARIRGAIVRMEGTSAIVKDVDMPRADAQ